MVRLLLDYDADYDHADQSGRSPLIQCVYNGHYLCTRCLLEAGADINSADSMGMTSLHYSATFGHTDMLSLLLDFGANISVQDLRGYSPLHCSMANGRKEAVMVLVKYGADIEASTFGGLTPADCTKNRGMVKLLVSNFQMRQSPSEDDLSRTRNSNSCPTSLSILSGEIDNDNGASEFTNAQMPLLSMGLYGVLGGLPLQSPHGSLTRPMQT
eukprot:TRINITY_DN3728_c0_g1_i3.p1 TRINITY_DN3728_c0_g1~~TRINITY_DN3728_c0_g1_i3.p1  ORF type:complete len:213 (+),score=28.30 TRINITY_DN3728_c0_g1_i3:298-936(+)